MTSVTPNLPFLPFGPSTGGDLLRERREEDGMALSFERLLGEVARAAAIPLNATFAETGTLGFEGKHAPVPVAELGHTPDPRSAALPRSAPKPDSPQLLVIAPTAAGKTSDPATDVALMISAGRERQPPLSGGLRAGPHPKPALIAAWQVRSAAIAMDDPPEPPQRTPASERAQIEDALLSPGANVSVALELIGDTLRVHVHLPACPDPERQRLIGRAREILNDRGLTEAELVIHEQAFNHGTLPSEGESVRGA